MNSQPQRQESQGKIILPDIPALCVNARQAALLTTDGEIRVLDHETAGQLIHNKSVLLCHAPYTCKTIGIENVDGFDLLELFAFVHPAKFCVPTPVGLSKTLGISIPTSFDEYPYTLMEATRALLSDLQQDIWQAKANPLKISSVMGQQGKRMELDTLYFLNTW